MPAHDGVGVLKFSDVIDGFEVQLQIMLRAGVGSTPASYKYFYELMLTLKLHALEGGAGWGNTVTTRKKNPTDFRLLPTRAKSCVKQDIL